VAASPEDLQKSLSYSMAQFIGPMISKSHHCYAAYCDEGVSSKQKGL
jgi:hypothetical protein